MIGYTVAAIGVVLVLSFQCFMEYTFIQLRNMNHKLDDVVLTADDFTATVDIPEEVWKVHTNTFDESDMHHLKTNLEAFTERIIFTLEKQYSNPDKKDEKRLAYSKKSTLEKKEELNPIVQYVFNNGKLLSMLEKRATALKAGDFTKVEKVQDEMTAYKAKYFEELMRPRQAYIGFQNQSNLATAIKDFETLQLDFNEDSRKKSKEDQKKDSAVTNDQEEAKNEKPDDPEKRFELKINRAQPVSDIIWENMIEEKVIRERGRTSIFWLVMSLLLGLFFVFSVFSSYQVTFIRYMITPIGVDCTNFYRQEDNLLEQKAFIEYLELGEGEYKFRDPE